MRSAMRVVMKLAAATVAALLWIGFATAAGGGEKTKSGGAGRSECGNITIQYPFGFGKNSYLHEGFKLSCDWKSNLWTTQPPGTQITAIDYSKGEMDILMPVSRECHNESGQKVVSEPASLKLPDAFTVSSKSNTLFSVGCNTYGVFKSLKGDIDFSNGCGQSCDRPPEKKDARNCSGWGCCQTDIPAIGLRSIKANASTFEFNKNVWKFNNCSYCFVAKDGWYDFIPEDLTRLRFGSAPLVIYWAVGDQNQTCKSADKEDGRYVCGNNTECVDTEFMSGYNCKCKDGYGGNPYHSSGCRDVDECSNKTAPDYPCVESAICKNHDGGYTCLCLKGYEGDGQKKGTKCTHKPSHVPIIGSSVSVAVTSLVVVSFFIYWGLRKRRLSKLREHFFQQNGGILLQQQIARNGGPSDIRMKIFTLEDLEKATNNFDEKNVLGQGGYGTVYKGVLTDTGVVAIKKSKICEKSQVEQFINEVVVLSQINHRNVVKLFGCCLETEVPLLVYEFITNGTLYEHLHTEVQSSILSWAVRLRVASESAGALSYLHSAASPPIIHRDVKTANILLDDTLTAKVGDFGASRLVPLNRTQVTTLVQGTFGYLDPEYFHTGQLTDKSDVYSFGVVLAELLTGEKAISPTREEDDRNLGAYLVSSLNNGRLSEIVDNRIVNDVNFEQFNEVAKIASQCLKVRRDDRPTMKQVAMEIEGLIVLERNFVTGSRKNEISAKEFDHLSASSSSHAINNVRDSFTCGGNKSDGESMEPFSRSLSSGR
ncbi:unnamed protein product [Cuscuta epithymum]|uniref:Protein kinase domain-containing protein n=1 Tax=Cuscuta epithymum TaxID=186058 RepID=A0AAV0C487_9ASTE|nr:unnamed protein product [Cuscuta epithymum]